MSKKLLVLLALLFGLTILAAVLFFKKSKASAEALKAVPAETAVLLRFDRPARDIEQIRGDSIWDALKQYDLIAQMDLQLSRFDSVFPALRQSEDAGRLLLAIDRSGASETGILIILEVSQKEWLRNAPDGKIIQKYRGKEFREFARNSNRILGFKYHGLLIASSNAFMLEGAWDALTEGYSISTGEEWEELNSLSEKNNRPRLYLQMDKLPGLLSSRLNEKGFSGLRNAIETMGDWLVADLLPLDGVLFLSGYLHVPDSSSPMLYLHEPGEAPPELASAMPYHTAAFYSYRSHSFDALSAHLAPSQELRDLYLQYFTNWMGHEIGIAVTEPFASPSSEHSFLIIHAADTLLARAAIVRLAGRFIDGSKVPFVSFEGRKIYRLTGFDDLESLLGLRSKIFSSPWVVVTNQHVVFANSLNELKVWLEYIRKGQTLAEEEAYREFNEEMSDRSILTVYLNSQRAFRLMEELAGESMASELEKNFKKYSALNPIGFQVSEFKNPMFLVNAFTRSSQGEIASNALVWKCELDTSIQFGPQTVINHLNKRPEIVVQDASNTLYLINGGGDILWKKTLDAPIVGKVEQVDFYRNGKLQYLFTTSRSIQLIDRLGRNVEDFPLRLPAAITSGISVIDYNRNGNYRIFVACENKNIYGFERSGKPLKGWSPHKMDAQVRFPITHFVADTRDYLMILDEEGTVHLVNRKGRDRKGPSETKSHFLQNFSVEINRSEFRLINMDENGTLFTIRSDEKVQKDTLVNTVGPVRFEYAPISSEEGKNYVLLDDEHLRLFSENQTLLFTWPLPHPMEKDLQILRSKKNQWIALHEENGDAFYLIDWQGRLYKNGPLPGTSLPVLAPFLGDGSYLLISGGGANFLQAFRFKESE